MPGGIGSTSEGSDSVNRSPPTENSTSYWSSTLRTSGASRIIEPRNSGCEDGYDAVLGTNSV